MSLPSGVGPANLALVAWSVIALAACGLALEAFLRHAPLPGSALSPRARRQLSFLDAAAKALFALTIPATAAGTLSFPLPSDAYASLVVAPFLAAIAAVIAARTRLSRMGHIF